MDTEPLCWPAPERNKDALLRVLAARLPSWARVLEVAAGTGQHAVHFTRHLAGVQWLPTDPEPAHVGSIAAYRSAGAAPGLLAPVQLDVRDRDWPVDEVDAVFTANLLHISPWAVTGALLDGAARVLRDDGLLLVYGPFLGHPDGDAPSNVAFDASLRGRDPAWGVRRLDAVVTRAREAGLTLSEDVAMPANNRTLVFERA